MAWGIYNLYRWLQPGFRKKRTELFLNLFRPGPQTRILDVGGYVYDWFRVVPVESSFVFLNVSHPPAREPLPERFDCVVGDGRKMSFPDRSFDIAYSNSVIEHVGGWEDQQRFAAEVRRVADGYFVQTPNRWFPIEPHFVTLFVHWLPAAINRRIIRFVSYRGWFRSGDDADLTQLANELRLLSKGEMKQLFPDAELHREKWFGMTKSWIAIRRPVSAKAVS